MAPSSTTSTTPRRPVDAGRREAPGQPPTPPTRGLRLPQLAVGLMLTGCAALGFVLWNAAATQRSPVLALAQDVERGHVLELEDLRIVHVGTDDAIATVADGQAASVVGRVAVTDLGAGTLVVPDQFIQASALTPGAGVVGLALAPGQYPSPQLRVGDLVNVLDVSNGQRVVVEAAEVVGVESIGTQGQRFVSVLAGEQAAGEVASVAATGEVRLILVARGDGEATS